ncbi:unnamed protein product [Fusarium graminearum]|nr:unnamed protein product [Fusarium graminearum]
MKFTVSFAALAAGAFQAVAGQTVYFAGDSTMARSGANDAAKALVAKGAQVVLSTQTPNNQWETGTFEPGAPRFVGYVSTAHRALASSSVTWVDHFAAVTKMYQKLGNQKVNSLYPRDHTHTSPEAADLIAKAFVQAINEEMNGRTSLKSLIKTPVSNVY